MKKEQKEPLDFREVLSELGEREVPVIINGMDRAGRILEVQSDFIKFQMIWEEEKGTGKTKEKVMKKETLYIPLKDISSVSDGEKEIPKTKKEQKINDDLGSL